MKDQELVKELVKLFQGEPKKKIVEKKSDGRKEKNRIWNEVIEKKERLKKVKDRTESLKKTELKLNPVEESRGRRHPGKINDRFEV